MKKLTSTLLIIITILAMSLSTFAAGGYKFVGTASKNSVSASEVFTVSFALTDSNNGAVDNSEWDMEYASCAIGFTFNNTAFELVEIPTLSYGYIIDSKQSTKLSTANSNGRMIVLGDAEEQFRFLSTSIMTAKFKAKEDASANSKLDLKTIDGKLYFNDGAGDYSIKKGIDVLIDDVTVKASTPTPTPISPVAGTEIKVGNTTYTDVVNFASSVSGSGAKLSFDLFENGTKHGNTYSVNLADWGLTIEEGTLNFKVAIIGAPSTGVTMNNITLGN